MDPLELIRSVVITAAASGTVPPLECRDSVCLVGGQEIPAATPTRFARTAKSGGHYTVGEVVLFLLHSGTSESDYQMYRRQSVASKTQAVGMVDKGPLRAYLRGEIDEDQCAQMQGGVAGGPGGAAGRALGGLAPAGGAAALLDDPAAAAQQRLRAAGAADRRYLEAEARAELLHTSTGLKRKLDATTQEQQEQQEEQEQGAFNYMVNAGILAPTAALEELAAYTEVSRRALASCHGAGGQAPLGQLRQPEATPTALLQSRAAAMCCLPEARLGLVLDQFNRSVLRQLKGTPSGNPNPSSEQGARQPGDGARRGRPVPIVLVPTALTSMITLANVAQFLVGNSYVAPQEARATDADASSSEPLAGVSTGRGGEVVVQTMRLGTARPVTVRFVDSAAKLSEAEWHEQVVAVFATGQAWQFKGAGFANGRFPRAPVDLFMQVLGLHLMFDDKPVDPNVASWNCKVLKISRGRRHQDAVAANQFWGLLAEHIKLQRPHLLSEQASGITPSDRHKKHHHQAQ